MIERLVWLNTGNRVVMARIRHLPQGCVPEYTDSMGWIFAGAAHDQ